ncbi:hypothetical protein GCM10010885_07190 [Alicyclobacillus cellulosilyticus]|uniref:Methane monooxygenase PmoA-like n=1 Tax=Alicyclobacillus cellulosilyticus TaxID=1003997 RepID=A0A917NIJ6_9BACL|nr:PmoA family protein [Alicyclobacillus cellulosilyticus]GGJ00528.1 hypothetical protein GCM10010885_07190 [Alicyclobacillus cellulosilyticus]
MQERRLRISAGPHARRRVVLKVDWPADEAGDIAEVRDEAGRAVPFQVAEADGRRVLHLVVDDIPAGEERVWTVRFEPQGRPEEAASLAGAGDTDGVVMVTRQDQVEVVIDGQLFTFYVFDPAVAKPFLGPLLHPGGESWTRLDFATREHPHHRSVWLGIGDVNGTDTWNEPAGRFGWQRQTAIRCTSGPVFGTIQTENVWTDFDGRPLMDDVRTWTFYRTEAGRRVVDIDFTLYARYGDVTLGRTKEAGPLGVRVADSIKADAGGVITNAYGAIGEAECWGRRAHWCDYSGPLGGGMAGIAVMDHPENDGYPTHWHVRDYGLMAPNNLFFRGEVHIPAGGSRRYRYRLYFHDGDVHAAGVAQAYLDYVHPPQAAWV